MKPPRTVLGSGFWGPESRVHLPGFATPCLDVSSSNQRLAAERNSYLLYFLLYLHFVGQHGTYSRRSGYSSLKQDRYRKEKLAGQQSNKHGFTLCFHSGVRFRGDVEFDKVHNLVSE